MSNASLDPSYDVIVAGARCAGASTAMLMARRGLRVLVVDPLPRGRDTLSTHALMRAGVVQLHRWGLLDRVRAAGTPPIHTTTFDYGDEVIPIQMKPRDGVDALYAPRRTVLDPILADGARDAGARVVHGSAVVDLVQDSGGRVRGAVVMDEHGETRELRADLVVGADGVRSRVARMVDAPVEHRAAHTTACIYGYWTGIPRKDNRWTFRPGVGIGTIPTNDGATCVFVSVPPDTFHRKRKAGLESLFHETLSSADPALAEDMAAGTSQGPLRGFAGTPGFLRRAWGPGWALVGDAGYFKDPLTAHGITDAFRDAELLADAVASGAEGALREYQARRDAVARGFIALTDRIASLAWTMDEVKLLHQQLNREMNATLEVVRDLDLRRLPAA